MTTVLVIEDDQRLRRALEMNLSARDHDVVTAADGATGLESARANPPDLVILDLGLPDMEGSDIIRSLRSWSTTPILVLSARSAQGDKVDALDAGADDYVTKPFGMGELLARVRVALRRDTDPAGRPVVETAAFTVDLAAGQVLGSDGRRVHLTPKERKLLEVLAANADRLVTQRQLLHDVWGPAYRTEAHYLRVYMAQLRRKLEPDPGSPRHLITEPGLGYRLVT